MRCFLKFWRVFGIFVKSSVFPIYRTYLYNNNVFFRERKCFSPNLDNFYFLGKQLLFFLIAYFPPPPPSPLTLAAVRPPDEDPAVPLGPQPDHRGLAHAL